MFLKDEFDICCRVLVRCLTLHRDYKKLGAYDRTASMVLMNYPILNRIKKELMNVLVFECCKLFNRNEKSSLLQLIDKIRIAHSEYFNSKISIEELLRHESTICHDPYRSTIRKIITYRNKYLAHSDPSANRNDTQFFNTEIEGLLQLAISILNDVNCKVFNGSPSLAFKSGVIERDIIEALNKI